MTKPLTAYQRGEAFAYLDSLRDGGTVAMDTGYTPTYLCDVFGHDYGTAWSLLQEWLVPVEPPPVAQVQPTTAEPLIEFRYSGPAAGLWPLLKAMAHGEPTERACPECERPVEPTATACAQCTASDHWEAS